MARPLSWKRKPARKDKTLTCNHCGKPCVVYRGRGLCWTCYGNPGIRESYGKSKYAPGHEPTMEELDAIIAEQMKCLPNWWYSSMPREGYD
jgi:hypothetical protein